MTLTIPKSRRRLVVTAYACDPFRGSEAGIGWSWALKLSENYDTTVVCRRASKPLIDAALDESGNKVRFDYLDLPDWFDRICAHLPAGHYIYYTAWQVACAVHISHNSLDYDLAHHLTYGAVWLPTFLPFTGLPAVLGPLGGAERTPRSFLARLAPMGLVYEGLRSIARTLALVSPLHRLTMRKAALGLAKTAESAEYLLRCGLRSVVVMSELAIESNSSKFRTVTPPSADNMTLVTIGRMRHFKGVEYSLRILRQLVDEGAGARLILVGDGPDMDRLRRLADSLELADQVEYIGWVSRERVAEILQQAHFLVHPSLHDSSGNVLIEALVVGTPCVALDTGGSAQTVPEGCGYLANVADPDEAVSSMARYILELANDSALYYATAMRAQCVTLERYGWDRRLSDVERLYASVLGDSE